MLLTWSLKRHIWTSANPPDGVYTFNFVTGYADLESAPATWVDYFDATGGVFGDLYGIPGVYDRSENVPQSKDINPPKRYKG